MLSFFTKKKKKVHEKWCLFLIATCVTFYGIGQDLMKGTQSIESVLDQQREGLIETAHAYYRQGVQLQYDSYKKNLYSTPEDATAQHYTYTVCSGFTFQVYYQTLGIRIPDTTEELLDYAESNKDNKDTVLLFYGSTDEIYSEDVLGTIDSANYSNYVDSLIDVLLPGDVIVVTGHAFMVDSIDYDGREITIIESGAGGRYNYDKHYDNYDENGTIQFRTLNTKLKTYYNRITNDTVGDEIERMAVIRFVTDGESFIDQNGEILNYELTDSALSRLKFPNIDIEKLIKISNSSETISQNILTDIGEYITYEINVTNGSDKAYDEFEIIENISPQVIVTDGGNSDLLDNQLKWNVSSLEPGESVSFKYTVKVINDSSLYGDIIVSSGMVDDIATSKIETLIGNKLSDVEEEKISSSLEKLKNNSSNEREFINDIYLDALGLDLGLSNELSNLDIISYDSGVVTGGNDTLSVKFTRVNDTPVSKYIYNNFYGLRINEANNPSENLVRAILQWNIYTTYELNDRARTLIPEMLSNGDIVLVYTGETGTTDENLVDKSYIYLDDKLIRKISSTEFEEISGDELVVFLRNIIGDNYVILRPSIGMANNYKLDFDSSLEVLEELNYVKYMDYKVTVGELLEKITVVDGIVSIYDVDNNKKGNEELLVTGDKLIIYVNDTKRDEYVISINGDANGDGEVDLIDLVQIRKHIVEWVNPNTGKVENKTGVYYYAIDMNNDDEVDLIDLIRMRKAIVDINEED